ncbi:uncharacterized protein LOC114441084 [Parambassis ranga]|uniref:Uncharacterized protein LOC114441084 n=1 Tax=Parambassis ranga TaxID=210632 RepID=A0A6P7IZ84_9TELE|nr:uncharacterized protein LOC114441084 [Parambassis ranga]
MDIDLDMMKRQERAHFFSSKEQELILKLYDEEREILTAKSNTSSASKLREEAWKRIAEKINAVSDSGFKRTWQQVKVKHKNIVQTAKRRRAEIIRSNGGAPTLLLNPYEEDDDVLKVEVFPESACVDPITGPESLHVSAPSQPALLMPVTKTEPESSSSDETDISDAQFEGDTQSSSCRDRANSAGAAAGSKSAEKQTDDIKALYRCYLKKEMENRDQEMAYRALKMRKLEKEILLLDKQLMDSQTVNS